MNNPSHLQAVLLNCTLKKSPQVSNTEALMRTTIEWFDTLNVTSDLVRVVDFQVAFGVSSDEGDGDEWPTILTRIKGRRHHRPGDPHLVRCSR